VDFDHGTSSRLSAGTKAPRAPVAVLQRGRRRVSVSTGDQREWNRNILRNDGTHVLPLRARRPSPMAAGTISVHEGRARTKSSTCGSTRRMPPRLPTRRTPPRRTRRPHHRVGGHRERLRGGGLRGGLGVCAPDGHYNARIARRPSRRPASALRGSAVPGSATRARTTARVSIAGVDCHEPGLRRPLTLNRSSGRSADHGESARQGHGAHGWAIALDHQG